MRYESKYLYRNMVLLYSKLPLRKVFILAKLYVEANFSLKQAQEILEISATSLTDWTNFCREIISSYVSEHQAKIGGEGITVEVDEAKFGRRKHHKGRIIDGTWVFGAVESLNKSKCFFVPVPNRSAQTLVSIIKNRIEPGTTIISDCWRAYDCLKNEDYNHLTVNHTYNFVDPDTGAHTNNIEREWRDVRSMVYKLWVGK